MIDGPVIQTASGAYVSPLEPWTWSPSIEDIAQALSNQCRFSGHVRTFYSVAEHSCRVADLCPPEFALAGLLHDASEAYLVDLPSPLKHHPTFGSGYRYAEDALQERLDNYYRVDSHAAAVRRADLVMLATEKRDLMPSGPDWLILEGVTPVRLTIEPWSPGEARESFLSRFQWLSRIARAAAA